MELHLLLLDSEMDPSSKMSAEQFEIIKGDMLRAYDEAKHAKREVKAEKRSWEYKKAFDQRSENELNVLEARVESLKDKRSSELKQATRKVTDVADRSDNVFGDIVASFESAKAELEAFGDAGKLSMAQGAFLDQINQFFENVKQDHTDEYSDLKQDAESSATSSKFTDNAELASQYAEELMGDYYYGITELQTEWTEHASKRQAEKNARAEQRADFEASIESLKQDREDAKAAGNDDLVKKITEDIMHEEKAQSVRNFEYEVSDRRASASEAELQSSFESIKEDMQKKLSFITDAMNKASDDGSEIIFARTGSAMTPEHLYSYAKNEFAEEDIKAAYHDLETVTNDYNSFDASVKAEAKHRLSQVNSGIFNLGSAKRSLDFAIEGSDADKHAAEQAQMDADIAEYTDMKAKIQNDIAKAESEKVAQHEIARGIKTDIKGLDPAAADYTDALNELEASLAKVETEIEMIDLSIDNYESARSQVESDLTEAVDMKAEAIAIFNVRVQHVPIFQADYDRVKERVINKQLEYSGFLVDSEDERMKKINEIAAVQEAVDAVDTFAVVIDFSNGNMSEINIDSSSAM